MRGAARKGGPYRENFGRRQPTLAAESHGSRILVGDFAVLGLVNDVLENAES